MRDRKNRSGAGVDNRLNIKVIGQLPKLLAELQTPDTMVQGKELVKTRQSLPFQYFVLGELRCCELELKNTGPVAMTSLHLVSQTPGLLSFGRRKGGEEERSLYDFPLIEDGGQHFKKQREDGTVEQVRRYLHHMMVIKYLV